MRALKASRRRYRRRDRDRSALARDRRSLELPDIGNPGAGRARNRLQARDQWRDQDRSVATAQRHPERRRAAGPEGRRDQQPPDREQHPRRHDAGERLVRQTRDQRTPDRAAGAQRAAAARTRARAQCAGEVRRPQWGQRRHNRARQRHRRHDRVFQFARPRRKPHRNHQRRRHHRCRPQGQRHRQCPLWRAPAEIRDQGDRAIAAAGAAEHPGRIHLRRTRPVPGAGFGQGGGAAERQYRDDQRPLRHARRQRVQRLGLGRRREQAAGEARSRFPAAVLRGDAGQRRRRLPALEQRLDRPQRAQLRRRAGPHLRC